MTMFVFILLLCGVMYLGVSKVIVCMKYFFSNKLSLSCQLNFMKIIRFSQHCGESGHPQFLWIYVDFRQLCVHVLALLYSHYFIIYICIYFDHVNIDYYSSLLFGFCHKLISHLQ